MKIQRRRKTSLLPTLAILSGLVIQVSGEPQLGDQDALVDPLKYKAACPDYLAYSKHSQYVLYYRWQGDRLAD